MQYSSPDRVYRDIMRLVSLFDWIASNMSRDKLPPDPVIEAYKQHVDRSLLRANLRLTVEERVLKLMEFNRFAAEMRRAGKEAKKKP